MDLAQLTSVVYLTIGVVLCLIGILIFRESPSQRVHRATAVMIFLASLGPIMGAFGLILNRMGSKINLDVELFRRIFLVWEFFFPQLLYFSMIFPRERGLIRQHPRTIYLIYLPHFLHFWVVWLFRSPDSFMAIASQIVSNYNSELLLRPILLVFNLLLGMLGVFYEFHTNFFALINLIYVIAAIFIMYKGYQELTSSRAKRQAALVLWGIRVSVGLYAVAFLLPKLLPIETSDAVIYFLTILALLIGAGSIAWAIIKYQFLDISQQIRQRFLFSICTGLIIGIYLLLYNQCRQLSTSLIGLQLPLLEIMFIIIAVVIFQPTLSGIDHIIQKLFGREKADADQLLQQLSHEILTILDFSQLREKITNALAENLMLENVHLIARNKAGDFVLNDFEDTGAENDKFSSHGDFIRAIEQINRPVGFDELIPQIKDPVEIDLLNRLNCYLLIPLAHRGTLNGILCLGNKLTRTSFSAEDARLLNVLSNQIAIALENIDLYRTKLEQQQIQKEILVAREIQKALLPSHVPQGSTFEISAMNIPSKEVGGDYYDFIQFDDDLIGIAIGDISGKGIPGAMLMSNLQATLRASVWQFGDPAEIMKRINAQIAKTTSAEKFATFFYGILDAKKLTFTFSNAGHNYPIIKKQNGQFCHLTEGGLVIGVNPNFEYHQTEMKLDPGDTLIFYTDGITEALNPQLEEFGEQRLLDIILNWSYKSAEELRNLIYEEMIKFTEGQGQYDDLTLIVLRILPSNDWPTTNFYFKDETTGERKAGG
ncbi:MAG: SpoIIE family protein phosphatase [candidate division KSB1 bacterium]|nr:SpoIIE family protein phosphatase [candidate division KSB1 bacterium]MDZ7333823.1 SpoIIE family protein phosphatase [candidate division KSB1 bacterium]MDZ7400583.1 SpoIIE family protein phosphatase [candidate division KSB1 bacterium]